jgi:putative hydrolase of the HAD superfamily
VYTSPDWRRPLPGTLDALATLRGLSVRLHLVSNSSDMLLESLSRLGWDRLFEAVTFSQEVGAEKPDKRVFDLALKRAGCGPEDVVHVGDSLTADDLGARGTGLRAIWFNRGGSPPPEP